MFYFDEGCGRFLWYQSMCMKVIAGRMSKFMYMKVSVGEMPKCVYEGHFTTGHNIKVLHVYVDHCRPESQRSYVGRSLGKNVKVYVMKVLLVRSQSSCFWSYRQSGCQNSFDGRSLMVRMSKFKCMKVMKAISFVSDLWSLREWIWESDPLLC